MGNKLSKSQILYLLGLSSLEGLVPGVPVWRGAPSPVVPGVPGVPVVVVASVVSTPSWISPSGVSGWRRPSGVTSDWASESVVVEWHCVCVNNFEYGRNL